MPTRLKTTSVPEAVYDALRERILSARIAPGELVTETAIAVEYGVARPTAKAALERLVAEGLLTRRAHKTARVPQLDRADIIDLFENRAIVESAAIAALASEPAPGRVPEAALAAHRELLEQARADAPFAQEDIAFHRALVAGQTSPRLARMHALLMGEIELCIGQVQAHHLLTARAVASQHQGILDAVVAGNADLASRLTREHIVGTRERLLAHYDSIHS
ncbi:MAG: GntR family transcriptional regulator [Pseudolysinimonas sp.]